MIHFRSASGLRPALAEHKPGSFAVKITLHETSLFRYLILLRESRFQKISPDMIYLARILLMKILFPYGNLYFIR
jgi:hypothetical protein